MKNMYSTILKPFLPRRIPDGDLSHIYTLNNGKKVLIHVHLRNQLFRMKKFSKRREWRETLRTRTNPGCTMLKSFWRKFINHYPVTVTIIHQLIVKLKSGCCPIQADTTDPGTRKEGDKKCPYCLKVSDCRPAVNNDSHPISSLLF